MISTSISSFLDDLVSLDNFVVEQHRNNQELLQHLCSFGYTWRQLEEIERDLKILRRRIDIMANESQMFELEENVPDRLKEMFQHTLMMLDFFQPKWAKIHRQVEKSFIGA